MLLVILLISICATLCTSKLNCIHLVQYGKPRTGSTFQFAILDAINVLKGNAYTLTKTHITPSHLLDKCVFVSQKQKSVDQTWLERHPVLHIQKYEIFSRYPLHEIEAYTSIFNLTNDERNKLHVYMKYWNIIRRCCGSQASVDYRNMIHGIKKRKHLFETVDFMDCSIYNITEVERLLFKTTIANRMQNGIVVEYNRPKAQPNYCKKEKKKLYLGYDFNGKILLPANK